jgi:hypothetical protein
MLSGYCEIKFLVINKTFFYRWFQDNESNKSQDITTNKRSKAISDQEKRKFWYFPITKSLCHMIILNHQRTPCNKQYK